MKHLINIFFLFVSYVFANAGTSFLSGDADTTGTDTLRIYTSLEDALKEPERVYRLILKRNKLAEIPKDIFQLKNLRELRLNKNRITEIPSEIGSLVNLEVLDVSRNRLTALPPEIGKLKKLKELIVFVNEIPYLPPGIGDLKNLEILDMWGNEIIELPGEIRELKKLRVLDLRVIEMNKDRQNAMKELLPHTKIHFSKSCNCG